MTWVEVSLAVPPEQVETAAEIFRRFCYGGVAIEEPILPDPGGEGYAVAAGAPWTVKGYLPVDSRVGLRTFHLRRALLRAGFEPFRERTVQEEDWANAWKAFFHPLRVGHCLVVKPAWERYTPEPGDVLLELDPGMAFGTGTHPTTRLCLAALERHLQRGWTVLDLGTGSGILAIAAAKLGAEAVLALDTDPIAVDAARHNVALNHLDGRVTVVRGSIDHPAVAGVGPVDLLVANLTAGLLLDLAREMVPAVRPGGLLVVSGLLVEREAEVRARFADLGCTALESEREEGWCALVLRGPGAVTDPAVLGLYGKPPPPPLRFEA
ncbi:MAG: 50S ribosomal protein L11 methyltransferase [Chloroflexi bacterium]|nr:50S ribosomal protein L11 methyltransferase [Chloroflexota bacterium]